MKLAVFGALAYQAAYAVSIAHTQDVGRSFYDDLFLAQTENKEKDHERKDDMKMKQHEKNAKEKHKSPWDKNKKILYSWQDGDGGDDCEEVSCDEKDDDKDLKKDVKKKVVDKKSCKEKDDRKAADDIDADLRKDLEECSKKAKEKREKEKEEYEKKKKECEDSDSDDDCL